MTPPLSAMKRVFHSPSSMARPAMGGTTEGGGVSARGFSLSELMAVAGIIALVGTAATVGIVRHRQDAEDIRMQAELGSIYKAMQAFRQIYGRFPRSNAELRPFISVPDFDNRYEINPNP